MNSVIFLIALLGVIYVLFWAIRNDDAGDDGPTRGFFGMTNEDRDDESSDD